MDESQVLLSNLLQTVPGCISDRQKLKATLMDILPSKKREVNLLLCAFDESIVEKLNNSSDPTLHALRMIKTLSDEYGLTKDAARWAVMTWCYIIGNKEIAEALGGVTDSSVLQSATYVKGQTHIIGIGTYKAGFDFKPGDIMLKHITKDLQSPSDSEGITVLGHDKIDCYINNSQGMKGAKKICSFTDSCHLEIGRGEYLILKTNIYWTNSVLIKIELTEFD